MRNPERLWRALEAIPGLAAVPAEWRRWLGDELAWVEQHLLRPTGELATVYPSSYGEPYQIIDHGSGRYKAVHPDGEPPIDLANSDITILRLDVVKLAGLLCAAFGFKAEPFTQAQATGRYRIGTWPATPRTICPVWFCVQPDRSQLHASLRHLAAEADGPLVVLTLSAIADAALARTLTNRIACYLPLSEAVENVDGGSLAVSPVGTRILEAFQRSVRTSEMAIKVDHPYVFRRDGDVWTLRFEGRPVLCVAHNQARGLTYINEAIQNPRHPLNVVDLDARVSRVDAVPKPGSAGEVLDSDARIAFRRQFDSLQAEIEEAERYGDEGRQERLLEQRAELEQHVRAATGLGGRARIAAEDVERVRKKVSMAISRAIELVEKHDSAMARHLRATVTTGRDITYIAEPCPDWVA